MAEPLKSLVDRKVVRVLADALADSAQKHRATFDRTAFMRSANAGLDELELLARGRHVAAAMRKHLPKDLGEAITILVGALTAADDRSDGGTSSFRWLPFSAFLEAHGTAAWDKGLDACRELTQRFTSEWCIRPFLEARPAEVLAVLATWSTDPSEHVRRLCSEGTRTRIPWGRRLNGFIAEPHGVLALVEPMLDDPSEYVRRSVANNLNDLTKDHPALVLALCARAWTPADDNRRRLVRHALRSLIKAGDVRALELVDADVGRAAASVEVTGRVTPKRVALGERATATIVLVNHGEIDANLVVDLVVHYVKANGTTSPKVFKGKTFTLAAGARHELSRAVVFIDRSIRRHFAGVHRIDAKVNGRIVALGSTRLAR